MDVSLKVRTGNFNVMYVMFLSLIPEEYIKSRLSFWVIQNSKSSMQIEFYWLSTPKCVFLLTDIPLFLSFKLFWFVFCSLKEYTHTFQCSLNEIRIDVNVSLDFHNIFSLFINILQSIALIFRIHNVRYFQGHRQISLSFVFLKCVISIHVKSK